MNQAQISIQEVLAQITATEHNGEDFLLKFIRSTGKKRGSIKTVAKARKGAPRQKRKPGSVNPTTLHKERGTIPITDIETSQYLTVLVSHIIQFNQYKVIH